MVKAPALAERRVVVFDPTIDRGPLIGRVLARRGAKVALIGPDDRGHTAAEIGLAIDRAAREIGPPTDYVIAPPPPAWSERRRSRLRFDAPLSDDAVWHGAIALGLEVPWRWLGAAIQRTPAAVVVLLLPRHAGEQEEAPDEAVCREGLIAFGRVAAERTQARVNMVEIAVGTPHAQVARTTAMLLSADGAGLNGQVLALR